MCLLALSALVRLLLKVIELNYLGLFSMLGIMDGRVAFSR